MSEKTKTKIVLFAPKPAEDFYFWGMPIALLKVASMLDRKKYDIKIIRAEAESDYKKEFLENVKDAAVLGVSSMTGYQIKHNIEMIKEAKKINPNLIVVWGGYHCSILPVQTLESEYADIVVKGQGERTFAELAECIRTNKSYEQVEGIAYKKNGKIHNNPDRPLEDMNNFPPTPFDMYAVSKCVTERDGKKSINLFTSQGCPYRCGFCAEPLVTKRRWFGMSAERVVGEMEFLYNNFGINDFILDDPNFFVDQNRVRRIAELILEKGLNISWRNANGRVNQLIKFDDAFWRLLKKSGCGTILIGAESGLQELLDVMNKDISLEDTSHLAEITRRHGVEMTFSLMIGIPNPKLKTETEKKQSVQRELNAILDLLDKSYPDEKNYQDLLLFVYTPYPGNPLYYRSIEAGFVPPKNLEEWADFEIVKNNLPWLPQDVFKTVQQLMDFMFPYACDTYDKKHIKKFGFLQGIFHKTALWRWKHRFFAFPVEYQMLLFYRKLRAGSAPEEQMLAS